MHKNQVVKFLPGAEVGFFRDKGREHTHEPQKERNGRMKHTGSSHFKRFEQIKLPAKLPDYFL